MLGFTERGEKYKMLGYALVQFYVEHVLAFHHAT